MRGDIGPGARFPDFELRDQLDAPRRLSDLQGGDPMIVNIIRGAY